MKVFTFVTNSSKLKMQANDFWSLYAQTVVRFDYYACEKYHETHQVANFERDGSTQTSLLLYADLKLFIVARQRKILHPDVTETTSLEMFEPQDDEMYIPVSDPLNVRKVLRIP